LLLVHSSVTVPLSSNLLSCFITKIFGEISYITSERQSFGTSAKLSSDGRRLILSPTTKVSVSSKEEKNTSGMIAYCGLDCSECKAFQATEAKDFGRKREIAEKWTREGDIEFKPEDINCEGCMSETISGWCRKICKIRPCAEKRKIKTCAHCEDYPCQMLKKFLSNESIAARNLEQIRKTLRVH
jgi:hypothetical protein